MLGSTWLALAVLVSCSGPQQAEAAAETPTETSGGPLRADQAGWDVLHYNLELAVDPARRSIAGTLTMRARTLEPTPRLALDLDARLAVERVVARRDGRELPSAFERPTGRIALVLEEPLPPDVEFEVAVTYAGVPREAPQPPWKGGFTWAQTADGRPWIATSCQGEGADLWWPCKDHPSDKAEGIDLVVTIPDGLFCASNGVLVADETSHGLRTQHWRMRHPISNYGLALNIAPYQVLQGDIDGIQGDPVQVFFWHLPESAEQARAIFPEFLDHLQFFEALLGPYPFRSEKYGVAETPHLGMEHPTVIAYGNGFRGGPDGFDWLHHHELAHEWWGNLVTCPDWKDMWLHEGFGTYMQALYAEERDGQAGLGRFMGRIREELGNSRPVAPRETHDSQAIYFDKRGNSDSDIYFKGAWVLHTLRWHLGDPAFFELLRRFAYPDPAELELGDRTQVRFADTEELRALAEEIHGEDLSWFFEVYLRQSELPQLTLARLGDELTATWRVPHDVPFPLDVPVSIDGRMLRLEVDESGTGRVPAGQRWRADPDGWLLKAD